MEKSRSHGKLIAGVIAAVAVVVIIALVLKFAVFGSNKGGEVITVTRTSLEEVLEISELSTVEYTYNAVAAKYDDSGEKVL